MKVRGIVEVLGQLVLPSSNKREIPKLVVNIENVKNNFEEYGLKCLDHIDADNQYIKSYPYLLKAVSTLIEYIGPNSLVTIAHIAYGWMPTILKKFDFSIIENEIFLDARNVSSFEDAKLFIHKIETSPINNSWVGLSKILHFINPLFFPIWDSKVAKHFGVSSHYQIKNKNNYVKFISFIEEQSKLKIVSVIQKEFKDRVNYEITKTRACEFILFTN